MAISWSWSCLRGETGMEVTQIVRKKGEVEGLEKSSPAWDLGSGRPLARASIAEGGRSSEMEGGLW